MNVSPINAVNTQTVNTVVTEPLKKEAVQPDMEGYETAEPAPTNADLYKSMYGVQEEKSYAEQMAEHRAKYETDINDKNNEIEANKTQTEEAENQEQKSYYEQYLEYKNKYQ